jgi:hypothetical protein
LFKKEYLCAVNTDRKKYFVLKKLSWMDFGVVLKPVVDSAGYAHENEPLLEEKGFLYHDIISFEVLSTKFIN